MSPVAVSQQPQASAGAGDELRSSKLNDILDGDVADESGGEAGESGNVTRDATSADTGKAQKGVFSAWYVLLEFYRKPLETDLGVSGYLNEQSRRLDKRFRVRSALLTQMPCQFVHS